MTQALPTGSAERKDVPLARGCLDYFPAALAAVARLSKAGNDKHNPGEEMHHARGKSMDHADCIVRHLADRGTVDPEDGIRHSVKVAWRALALLQEELEAAGEAPLARAAKLPELDKQDPPNENWCVGCTPDPDIYPGEPCHGCPPEDDFPVVLPGGHTVGTTKALPLWPEGTKAFRIREYRPPKAGDWYIPDDGLVQQAVVDHTYAFVIVEPVKE